MGYLSRYFLKYFKELNPKENFIIAPQAQSKYYVSPNFKHVGASWLTRENTLAETKNVMRYFDAIFEHEGILKAKEIIVLGYSQGVSVAMRYIASRQLDCSLLVLHSGGIPNELTAKDFDFFKGKTKLIYGTEDEYLDEKRIIQEQKKAHNLFGNRLEIVPFEGVHEVNVELIKNI